MDWKEALGKLKEDPSLPEGVEPEQSSVPEEKKGAKETLRVGIDRKGRKGKTAVIVEGFQCSDEEVADVAAELKKKLGVGGSSRGGEILIQGDCRDRVATLLKSLGYKVKTI